MQKVISTEKIPVKMWVDELEEGAIKQALNLANLPFAFRHICLMPDAHQGYGMPIGGVMAAKDVIVPTLSVASRYAFQKTKLLLRKQQSMNHKQYL